MWWVLGLENLHGLKSVFDMIKLLYSQMCISRNPFRLSISENLATLKIVKKAGSRRKFLVNEEKRDMNIFRSKSSTYKSVVECGVLGLEYLHALKSVFDAIKHLCSQFCISLTFFLGFLMLNFKTCDVVAACIFWKRNDMIISFSAIITVSLLFLLLFLFSAHSQCLLSWFYIRSKCS